MPVVQYNTGLTAVLQQSDRFVSVTLPEKGQGRAVLDLSCGDHGLSTGQRRRGPRHGRRTAMAGPGNGATYGEVITLLIAAAGTRCASAPGTAPRTISR